jgi:hypothetical protein
VSAAPLSRSLTDEDPKRVMEERRTAEVVDVNEVWEAIQPSRSGRWCSGLLKPREGEWRPNPSNQGEQLDKVFIEADLEPKLLVKGRNISVSRCDVSQTGLPLVLWKRRRQTDKRPHEQRVPARQAPDLVAEGPATEKALVMGLFLCLERDDPMDI